MPVPVPVGAVGASVGAYLAGLSLGEGKARLQGGGEAMVYGFAGETCDVPSKACERDNKKVWDRDSKGLPLTNMLLLR